MTHKTPIIDSHVHLDLIERHHPHRIQWLKENGCRVVSWSYFEGIDSTSQLKECLESKAQCLGKLSAGGLACHYLTGVHPRSIPPDLIPEQIETLLKPHLADPLCKGIGEIELETGGAAYGPGGRAGRTLITDSFRMWTVPGFAPLGLVTKRARVQETAITPPVLALL